MYEIEFSKEAVKTYLQVFQEPEEAMQMGQKMC